MTDQVAMTPAKVSRVVTPAPIIRGLIILRLTLHSSLINGDCLHAIAESE